MGNKSRTVGSVVERFVHIEEVTGPIPVPSTMKNIYIVLLVVVVIVAVGIGYCYFTQNNPVEKTYMGNEAEKMDLIKITSPRPNDGISSPLTLTGEARGNWFFEASFPVVLTDENGIVVATGIAQAKGDWMTESFVPFEATLTFQKPAGSDKGILTLKKDNPSGLPANDDALIIPIIFK
jgi:hypothetical protein